MEKVKENCGVVGVISRSGANAVPLVIDALRALQHRGQEAWGIAVPNRNPYKKLGLVIDAGQKELDALTGEYSSPIAIGHVRYSTAGRKDLEGAQPLKVKDLCIAHNGTLSNIKELSGVVGGCSTTPQHASDTLIAANKIVKHLKQKDGGFSKALEVLGNEMAGSYCFTFFSDNNDAVYAARDPRGFRPMVVGYRNDTQTYVVSSESIALGAVQANLVRDIQPGELLKIGYSEMKSEIFAKVDGHAHCSFEYTYFAHPGSVMEGISIYEARKRIGVGLAEKFPIHDADVVIPVPDSARLAAMGYAEATGKPFDEGLLKDRYSKKGRFRSFIEPHHGDRVEINQWIIPIVQVFEGKHVVVIDDSLVRGTSSKEIVKALRRGGARKISMLITFPPIEFPCFAGIDFPTQEELVIFGSEATLAEKVERVRKAIGVDFLGYNDPETLAKSIGMEMNSMCFTCATGNYSALGVTPKLTVSSH